MTPQRQAELARKIEELQAQMEEGGSGGAKPGWVSRRAAAGGGAEPIGWSVPIEVPGEGKYGPGTVTIDLCFGPESWKDAPDIIRGLQADGYEVRVYTPKSNNGGGFGRGNGGGGYGGNGGGFGGRGGFGRRY